MSADKYRSREDIFSIIAIIGAGFETDRERLESLMSFFGLRLAGLESRIRQGFIDFIFRNN